MVCVFLFVCLFLFLCGTKKNFKISLLVISISIIHMGACAGPESKFPEEKKMIAFQTGKFRGKILAHLIQ